MYKNTIHMNEYGTVFSPVVWNRGVHVSEKFIITSNNYYFKYETCKINIMNKTKKRDTHDRKRGI